MLEPQTASPGVTYTMRTGRISPNPDVEIFYQVIGTQGSPVVLVAGLADDHASWAGQIGYLARDHVVVTFDNRGIGRSSVPPGPYSTAEMADDAHALVVQLGLDPVCAIGSSMGGAICQEWALRHPGDIDCLILTNTWAERDRFLEALFGHWIRLGRAGLATEALESVLLFCYSPEYIAAHPTVLADALSAGTPPMSGFTAAAEACYRHDALSRLSQIPQRALVIGGEFDILTRADLSRRLARALRHAQLELLPTGHMIFWEDPVAFATLVLRFLDSNNHTTKEP